MPFAGVTHFLLPQPRPFVSPREAFTLRLSRLLRTTKLLASTWDLANALCKEIDATCTFSSGRLDSLESQARSSAVIGRRDGPRYGSSPRAVKSRSAVHCPCYDNSALSHWVRKVNSTLCRISRKAKSWRAEIGFPLHQKFIMGDKRPEIATVP